MTLLRAIARWWRDRPPPPGSPTWRRLRADLERNWAAEERLAELLRLPAPIDPEGVVEQILNLRESQVEIMRKLGWSDMADELAADTVMRRGWLADPPTPIF